MEPGCHYPRYDQEILRYLSWYVVGEPLPCRFIGETNLLLFQGEQPLDVRMPGSSGRWYYYTDCFYKQVSGPPTRNWRTNDGRGFWKSTDGQKPVYENGLKVGYKQDFRFRRLEAGREVSTPWVMTEYTLHSNRSNNNTKAVCVLRNTREGRGRGTTQ